MGSSGPLAKTAYILLILLISLILLYWGRQFLIPLVLAIMTWSLIGALAEFFRQVPVGSKKMPLDDIAHSSESSDYRLEDQSLWERLKAHGSALFSPVL